jgi:formylmethanofuran dehydrogenase subunit D
MSAISGLLVTVRSSRQGIEMMKGKSSDGYLDEIARLRVNPGDLDELVLAEGDAARIVSPFGEAVVTCHAADVPKGLFFLPLGPLANQLFSGAQTDGVGVPRWKRQPVTIEPASDAGHVPSGTSEGG